MEIGIGVNESLIPFQQFSLVLHYLLILSPLLLLTQRIYLGQTLLLLISDPSIIHHQTQKIQIGNEGVIDGKILQSNLMSQRVLFFDHASLVFGIVFLDHGKHHVFDFRK